MKERGSDRQRGCRNISNEREGEKREERHTWRESRGERYIERAPCSMPSVTGRLGCGGVKSKSIVIHRHERRR